MFNNEEVAIEANEKHTVEYLADMYSCITSVEKLERARRRDLLDSNEIYEASLAKLMRHFFSIEEQLESSEISRYRGFESFMSDYDMTASCAAAKARINKKVAEHRQQQLKKMKEMEGDKDLPRFVMETTQHLITLMDCLKLGQTAADQLFPILDDAIAAVKNVRTDFEYLDKLEKWKKTLDEMRASDQLDEEQTREMLYDLERAFSTFHKMLKKNEKSE